jgi:Asp/Glu/hydantoin racemase
MRRFDDAVYTRQIAAAGTVRIKGSRQMRIWYQSFVDPIEQAPYTELLRSRLATLSSPQTVIDVYGMSPPVRFFHPISEYRCGVAAVGAALQAQAEGYEAFVIGNFQEPGLTECRACVNIPVIGLGEATMLFACTLGRKIGLVTISPAFVPWHEEQIARHGLGQRVIGVTAIRADMSRFMRAFTDEQEFAAIRGEFVEQTRPLVARGAEVLIPAGGVPMLLFARQQPFVVDGAVVLDGVATVLKAAEMAIALHQITGAAVSRRATFAMPPDGAIEDFIGGTQLIRAAT